MPRLFCCLLLMGASCTTASTQAPEPKSATRVTNEQPDDPFLWLEEVEGEKALSWVHAQNNQSLPTFQKDARYETFFNEADTILNAKDKIPYGVLRGGFVYNFGKTTRTFAACGDAPSWKITARKPPTGTLSWI